MLNRTVYPDDSSGTPYTFNEECGSILEGAKNILAQVRETLGADTDVIRVVERLQHLVTSINNAVANGNSEREVVDAITHMVDIMKNEACLNNSKVPNTTPEDLSVNLDPFEASKLKRQKIRSQYTKVHWRILELDDLLDTLKQNFGYAAEEICPSTDNTSPAEHGLEALQFAASQLATINGPDISADEHAKALILLKAMVNHLTATRPTYEPNKGLFQTDFSEKSR